MSIAQARCPHCATLQDVTGVQLQPCNTCAESFYPAPLAPAATSAERKQQARQALRARAERESKEPVASWQVIRGTGVFFFLVGLSQLWFGAVMFGRRHGDALVVLRAEEPVRYWEMVAATFLIGAVLFALGHYMLRRIRKTIDRRYPQDRP